MNGATQQQMARLNTTRNYDKLRQTTTKLQKMRQHNDTTTTNSIKTTRESQQNHTNYDTSATYLDKSLTNLDFRIDP